jgi:tetratricopeptide (TPR) repeat protein
MAACCRRDIGQLFRIVNNLTEGPGCFTASHLARRCELTPSRVAEYMAGKRRVTSLDVVARIADGLGIFGSRFLLAPRPWEPHEDRDSTHPLESPVSEGHATADEDDEMNRRELLRILSVAGTQMALPLDASAPNHEDPIEDECAVFGHAQMNGHLWGVFSLAASKRTVYPLVRQQLNTLTVEMERARSEAERVRLCSLTADMLQLAGEVLFDANRYTDAAHCYTLAATASTQAKNFDLWACALARHAYVGMYERSFKQTVPVLDAASRVAKHGDYQLATRQWIAAVQAELFAELGDLDGCNRALDTAETVHGLNGQFQNGGWLRFDGSRIAEQRGACYTRLGRFDLAEGALTEALSQKLSSRRRGSVLIDLARLGAQRLDSDQILEYGSAAIELARTTGSGYISHKLRKLQEELAPLLSDKRVANLADSISAVATAA